uniref:ATP synthase subunit a n=1 Tax=Lygus hesperus TaxID=30085 RepID=A0A0A9Y0X8_LYGHE
MSSAFADTVLERSSISSLSRTQFYPGLFPHSLCEQTLCRPLEWHLPLFCRDAVEGRRKKTRNYFIPLSILLTPRPHHLDIPKARMKHDSDPSKSLISQRRAQQHQNRYLLPVNNRP